jgi:hypothetical protein
MGGCLESCLVDHAPEVNTAFGAPEGTLCTILRTSPGGFEVYIAFG